jgi:hypothetical protein
MRFSAHTGARCRTLSWCRSTRTSASSRRPDLKQSHSTRTKRKAIANIHQSCSDLPAIETQWMEFSEPTSVPLGSRPARRASFPSTLRGATAAAIRLDLWPPSPQTRFPMPIKAKAGPMPPHECFRLNDRNELQDRRKPTIQLDKKPAVVVRESDPATHFAAQNDQLMAERSVLCLKPAFRLEWRGQNRQDEPAQSEHDP